jgi:hypothetical protein
MFLSKREQRLDVASKNGSHYCSNCPQLLALSVIDFSLKQHTIAILFDFLRKMVLMNLREIKFRAFVVESQRS